MRGCSVLMDGAFCWQCVLQNNANCRRNTIAGLLHQWICLNCSPMALNAALKSIVSISISASSAYSVNISSIFSNVTNWQAQRNDWAVAKPCSYALIISLFCISSIIAVKTKSASPKWVSHLTNASALPWSASRPIPLARFFWFQKCSTWARHMYLHWWMLDKQWTLIFWREWVWYCDIHFSCLIC